MDSMSRAHFPLDSWRLFFRRGPLADRLFDYRSDPSTAFLCFQHSLLLPWAIAAVAFRPLLACSLFQTPTPTPPTHLPNPIGNFWELEENNFFKASLWEFVVLQDLILGKLWIFTAVFKENLKHAQWNYNKFPPTQLQQFHCEASLVFLMASFIFYAGSLSVVRLVDWSRSLLAGNLPVESQGFVGRDPSDRAAKPPVPDQLRRGRQKVKTGQNPRRNLSTGCGFCR